MLKKLLSIMLACCFAMTVSGAMAETVCDTTDRQIEVHGLQADGTFQQNPVIEGVSSTTGLPWTGTYMPMLTQIDNTDGGIGYRAPWGASQADIIYEFPLHKNGANRITFLFSDQIPAAVGPLRSARVAHIYLRQEWGGVLVHWGGPESTNYGLTKTKSELGVNKLNAFFDGTTGGKFWNPYMTRVEGLASPHNCSADLATLKTLVPENVIPTNHTFLFTDELPTEGDDAKSIVVTWFGDDTHDSSFTYNENEHVYYRFSEGQPYVDKDNGVQLSFSNVIVQRAYTDYSFGVQCPITQTVGCGNADIFIGGKYIPGYWMRTGADERTVYFDQNGDEIKLLRGKTYIIVLGDESTITYGE